ncbi:ribonuclease H-like domain-containing protein, partial [Dimargaris cristalligena]
MDITRDNFEIHLDYIQESISEASFIAIDAEFSGLHVGAETKDAPNDTHEDRYLKNRRMAEAYDIIQFEPHHPAYYEARTFNFYLFPTTVSVGRAHLDVMGSFQNSALDFLARSKFDFNKWITAGIPYMNPAQVVECRSRRQEELHNGLPDIPVDDKSEQFYRHLDRKLKKWASNPSAPLKLTVSSNYQRRLIHQHVRSLGPRFVSKSYGNHVQVTCISSEQAKTRKMQRITEFENNLKRAEGFSQVIKMLIRARKPLIGHNMFLDLCHLYDQFWERLPPTLVEFQRAIHKLFPRIWDTKNMAEEIFNYGGGDGTHHQLETKLEDLYRDNRHVKWDYPYVRLHNEFNRYESDKFHEAGFDSLITGIVFARLHRRW